MVKRGHFMSKFIAAALLFSIAALGAACGSAATNSNASANTNTNSVKTNIDPANMPEGLDPKPIPPSANETPGIPKDPMKIEKGTTPTPGIPSEEERKRGLKPGVTPTPGIPSPAELERLKKNVPAVNAVPANRAASVPMMKSSKRIQNVNKQ